MIESTRHHPAYEETQTSNGGGGGGGGGAEGTAEGRTKKNKNLIHQFFF